MKSVKTVFHEFHGLTLQHFTYLCLKLAVIPTILTGKRVKFLAFSLEAVIGGNKLGKCR